MSEVYPKQNIDNQEGSQTATKLKCTNQSSKRHDNRAIFLEKMNIIKKAKETKPHGFYFMEDYCDNVKLARGKLKAASTNARSHDQNAYLSFDKLVVVNDNNRQNIYVYDDVSGDTKCQIRNFDDKLTDAMKNK